MKHYIYIFIYSDTFFYRVILRREERSLCNFIRRKLRSFRPSSSNHFVIDYSWKRSQESIYLKVINVSAVK